MPIKKKLTEDNEHVLEENTKKPRKSKRSPSPEASSNRSNLIIVLLIASVFVLVASVFFPTQSATEVKPQLDYKWRIDLNIINSEFANKDSTNATVSCNGTASFPGIKGSTIYISDLQDKPLLTTTIPDAMAIGYSNCDYVMKLNKSIEIPTAKVKVWAVFPFGSSQKFIVNIGKTEPHSIKLNLNFS